MKSGAGAGARRSESLFAVSSALFPGGVSSPVRAFGGVGGTPRFAARGEGAWLHDEDGRRYADFIMSWGALPLGHAHPAVVEAITRQARLGTSYGVPSALEHALGERITARMPSIEMIRFVCSGTEAVMSAIRLSRAATSRSVVVKFAGCYHGHADSMLAEAGSGVATHALPGTAGVPASAVEHTIVLPYNDVEALERCMAERGSTIAAVIVEPVAGNMGFILPEPGFLERLRTLTSQAGALLIFDEVMTGFRVAPGGAQSLWRITPDLTCLGKVIGGGLPVGAYGGRRDLMAMIAPSGPVYQAGTLAGNPLAMAAGIATIDELFRGDAFERMAHAATQMAVGVRESAERAAIAIRTGSLGGMWGFFLSAENVVDYAAARRADGEGFATLFHHLLARGVHLPPSAFEACFTSAVHEETIISSALEAFADAFAAM